MKEYEVLEEQYLKKKKKSCVCRGNWRALSIHHATLDLGVAELKPRLGCNSAYI